jgi:hypothetical protein
VYGVRGEAIEDGCGEQPFTTALLDDRIRTIAAGEEVDDDLQLGLVFRDDVAYVT